MEWTCSECGEVVDSRKAGAHKMIHGRKRKAMERAQGNDTAVTFDTGPRAPIPTAPPGFVVVFNRLPRDYEVMFDRVPYPFKAHEYRVMTEEVATFMEATSIVRFDPATNEVTRALVKQGHPRFGDHLPVEDWVELIDRSTEANPLGRGTGGLKTTPQVVAVKGNELGLAGRER